VLPGAIDHRGTETDRLDEGRARSAIDACRAAGVRVFGCVGKFSTRNPLHENTLRQLLGPSGDQGPDYVTLGHELGGRLNFPRRLATAYFNCAVWRVFGAFADAALDKANFTLINAPDGVSVGSVLYISPTRCVVGLAFDGSDFAADYTRFHLVIAGAEVSGGSSLSSQNLPITAVGTGAGRYSVTPVTSESYTITSVGSGSAIASMTATAAGFKYFTVNVSPLENHAGMERVVFVQMRGGVQLAVNATAADFDRVGTAKAGFNVQAGDIIKAYIVDNTTGDEDANPTLLQ